MEKNAARVGLLGRDKHSAIHPFITRFEGALRMFCHLYTIVRIYLKATASESLVCLLAIYAYFDLVKVAICHNLHYFWQAYVSMRSVIIWSNQSPHKYLSHSSNATVINR